MLNHNGKTKKREKIHLEKREFSQETRRLHHTRLLTVTNWLFSSLMMSPTWTSIHFSLRSLTRGKSPVSVCEKLCPRGSELYEGPKIG